MTQGVEQLHVLDLLRVRPRLLHQHLHAHHLVGPNGQVQGRQTVAVADVDVGVTGGGGEEEQDGQGLGLPQPRSVHQSSVAFLVAEVRVHRLAPGKDSWLVGWSDFNEVHCFMVFL